MGWTHRRVSSFPPPRSATLGLIVTAHDAFLSYCRWVIPFALVIGNNSPLLPPSAITESSIRPRIHCRLSIHGQLQALTMQDCLRIENTRKYVDECTSDAESKSQINSG